MRIALISFICFFTVFNSSAQITSNPERCGTDSIHAQNMENQDFADAYRDKRIAVNAYLEARGGERQNCPEPIFIPVAVHFQGVTIGIGCAQAMAQSQIDRLNADFSATNADLNNWLDLKPQIWPGINHDNSCVQFCLATLNHPDGFGLNDGDLAVTIDETTGDSDAAWSGYLNFFVRDLNGGVLGYSPLGGNGDGDGVTCDINAFGTVNCDGNTIDAPYNLGRTMTHEVGHYFQLLHPWGDGGCASTDQVDDTPVTDAETTGCPDDEIITCEDPVLWPSYMEYCDDACLFMFSAGQVARMDAYVNTSLTEFFDKATTVCAEAACLSFVANATATDETCGGKDGKITFTASGGTAPYSFSIDEGITFLDTTVFGGLEADSFNVVVKDAQNCLFTETVFVEREEAQVTVVNTTNSYCGDESGSIEVSVNYPSNFQYNIDGVTGWQDSPVLEGLTTGIYEVIVRDSLNCIGSVEVELGDNSNLAVRVDSVNDVNCPWYDNGAIHFKVTGAMEPVIYVLDETVNSTEPYFGDLSVGRHNIYIADAQGCQMNYQFRIKESYMDISEDCPCTVYIPNAMTPDGDGINDVLDVVSSCPIDDYTFEVYNRWGVKIFESFNVEEKWNGSQDGYYVEGGIYYYKMSFVWGEGLSSGVDIQKRTGSVTVIR